MPTGDGLYVCVWLTFRRVDIYETFPSSRLHMPSSGLTALRLL